MKYFVGLIGSNSLWCAEGRIPLARLEIQSIGPQCFVTQAILSPVMMTTTQAAENSVAVTNGYSCLHSPPRRLSNDGCDSSEHINCSYLCRFQ